MALGSAIHSFLLDDEGEFEAHYKFLDPPINPRTGNPYGKETKAYSEWHEEHSQDDNVTILTLDDAALIRECHTVASSHTVVQDLMSGDNQTEGTAYATIHGVECQCRPDLYRYDIGALVDLKTCETLDWFEKSALGLRGYAYQLAFYEAVLGGYGLPVSASYIIAIQTSAPVMCGVWRVDPDLLAELAFTVDSDIDEYRHSIETDTWQTGYETMRVLGCGR
jgi:hypothetical protein